MTDDTRNNFDPGESRDHDLVDLRAENRRLRSGLQQMQDEVIRLGRALEPMHRLHEEIAQLRAELNQHQTESEACRGRAERLKASLQAANERALVSAEQLAAVYASSSWQFARPLRWLKRCVHR